MRIAVLVKQIPKFEEMELGPDGRLRRDGIELEMNPYCRRAVSKARRARGRARRLTRHGLHARATRRRRHVARGDRVGTRPRRRHRRCPRDRPRVRRFRHARHGAGAGRGAPTREDRSISCSRGRNSVDADTGQVGPELAELLDLPFLTGVRHLAIEGTRVDARCEHDDGWMQAEVDLPGRAVVRRAAVRTGKVDPPGRAAVPAERIRRADRRRPRRRARGAPTRRPRGSARSRCWR